MSNQRTMTFETWDIVPPTVNRNAEKRAETGRFPPTAEPIEIETVPVAMSLGAAVHAHVEGEPVVLVGTAPSGFTAIICPEGWRVLQRWKLTRLRFVKGALYATGKDRASGFAAARFLLNASSNHVVRHRNGNLFDIRVSNIVAISRGLLKQAKIETARGSDYTNPEVRWDDSGNVHRHGGKPLKTPSARHRVSEALEKDT